MGARWYNPGTGTFTSRDTHQPPPTPSTNTNRYTYAGGDPLDFIDPTGHARREGWVCTPQPLQTGDEVQRHECHSEVIDLDPRSAPPRNPNPSGATGTGTTGTGTSGTGHGSSGGTTTATQAPPPPPAFDPATVHLPPTPLRLTHPLNIRPPVDPDHTYNATSQTTHAATQATTRQQATLNPQPSLSEIAAAGALTQQLANNPQSLCGSLQRGPLANTCRPLLPNQTQQASGGLWDALRHGVGAAARFLTDPDRIAGFLKTAAPVVAGIGTFTLCELLTGVETGGLSTIGCAAAAGAIQNALSYQLGTPTSQRSLGGLLAAAGIGAGLGAATAGAFQGLGTLTTRLAAEASSGATRAVEAELPKLTGSIAESFANSEYSAVRFSAGQRFVRAEAWSATGPGRFLGLEAADTAAEAEQAYNIFKWGNPAEILRTYELTEDATLYFGRVASGEGYQALIPRGLDPASILRLVRVRPL